MYPLPPYTANLTQSYFKLSYHCTFNYTWVAQWHVLYLYLPILFYLRTNVMKMNTYLAAVNTWVEFLEIALIGESCALISPRRETFDSDHIFKYPLRHTLNSNCWSGTTANPQIQLL